MLKKQRQPISEFQPGGSQTELFLEKLKQQTKWDEDYCEQAIEEYKRFIYLMCVSPSPISPSVVVDEVWHLHLTFSRNYWIDMCEELLGCELHHDPSDVADFHIAQQQYELTLRMYREHFSEKAPERFWPRADTKSIKKTRKSFFPITALMALFTLTGSTWASSGGSSEGIGVFFIFIIIIIAGIGFFKCFSSTSAKKKDNDSWGGCSGGTGGGGDGGGGCCSGGGCGGGGCGGC